MMNCQKNWWTFELIDTWWDVNLHLLQITISVFIELIDTWWDVNTVSEAVVGLYDLRINRYMVGCKFRS